MPATTTSEDEFLAAAARGCRRCSLCWQVPCPACTAGGVCDDICNCEDPDYGEERRAEDLEAQGRDDLDAEDELP